MQRPAGIHRIAALRSALLGLALLLAGAAFAETGSIRLTSFPEVGVADARGTLTLTAEVRDNSGKLVPDGTQVVFQTNLGTLRETTIGTASGFVRATLHSPQTPGTAKVTASAIRYGATATIEIEFLSEAAMRDRARDHIEIVAPEHMMFSMELGVLGAAGANKGVVVRYGDLKVQADDMQLNLQLRELRARRATLTIGDGSRHYEELYLSLDNRKGLGTTTYATPVIVGVVSEGRWFRFVTKSRARLGLAEIAASGEIKPAPIGTAAGARFDFEDISGSSTMVSASKAVVIPQREIQFHRAEILVDGARAVKLPLFKLSLQGGAPTTLGEQIFTFNDSRIGIDYPHYLSLKPGETSLLRFRTGQRYGRTMSGSGGAFLDYELNWNRGSGTEGGLVVSGLTRPDWSVDINQHLRYTDGSSLSALLSSPAHRSLFGTVGYNKPLNGYSLSVSANASRSLHGPLSENRSVSLVLEKDPLRLKGLPLTMHYGLVATDSRFRAESLSESSRSVGARLRGQFDTFKLGSATKLNTSFTVNQLWATGRNDGLSFHGNAMLRHEFGKTGSMAVGYEYFGGNALESLATGRQRLSFEGYYSAGNARLSLFGSQSLDADWSTMYADGSYKLSSLFRLASSYTLDKYLSDQHLESNYTLWHRLGEREIGLTWSSRTKRLGIQFLGGGF